MNPERAAGRGFDVAMIGHFAVDRIVTPSGSRTASGGAVYYGGIALARLGLRVAVITRIHPSDRWRLDELTAEGIEVFATDSPESSGIENTYTTADMDRRTCVPLGFAGAFESQEIPDIHPNVWSIGPIIAGEVSLELMEALHQRGAPLALDLQGFVRVPVGGELVFREWPEMERGLALVKYLKLDSAEAAAVTGIDDIHRAAEGLARFGPKEIVLTHAQGILVRSADGTEHEARYRPRAIRGRTGRGDTTFAAYIGTRLRGMSAEYACNYAAALVSLKMEAPGPFNSPLEEVDALLGSPG